MELIDRIEETLRGMVADASAGVREAAAEALDRIRMRRQEGALLSKLKSGTIEERVRIVYAAPEIGGVEGLSILLAALADPNEEVRGAAVRTIEVFATPQVLQALVGMLTREKGAVLGNILDALGKSRRKELGPVVERYLEHPDAEIRGRAIVALARISGAAGWEKILRQAGSPDPAVRAAVARALGEWSRG